MVRPLVRISCYVGWYYRRRRNATSLRTGIHSLRAREHILYIALGAVFHGARMLHEMLSRTENGDVIVLTANYGNLNKDA